MCVTSKPVQYEELELLAIVAVSAVTLAAAENETDTNNNGSYKRCEIYQTQMRY